MTPEEQATADEAARVAAEQEAADKAKRDEEANRKLFAQSDVDRIVRERLADAKKAADKKAADEKAAADLEEARKKGEWEIVAEQKDAELTELRNQVTAKERETLRIKVAVKHRLPDGMADRLKGDTEAELEKDAAELAKHVVPPSPGNTMNGGGYQPNNGKLTTAQTVEKAKQERIASGDYNF